MFCLAVGHLPFHCGPPDDLIDDMIEFAGELPQEWQQKEEQLRREARHERQERERRYAQTSSAVVESMSELERELFQKRQQEPLQSRLDRMEEDRRLLREQRKPPGSGLEAAFREHVPEPELQVLLPVIKGLTKLSPSSRMSAGQALYLVGMPHEECYATDEGRNTKSY